MSVTLARVDNFLEAIIWSDLVEVRMSPLMEFTDALYAPVVHYFDSHCTRQLSREYGESDQFMFGRYTLTKHRVFIACPGEDVEHNCLHARRQEERAGRGL